MTAKVFLLILALHASVSSFTATVTCQEFHPVTENVPFKATYRVQTFVDGQPDSVSEIYEQYQHNLASSSVLVRRKFDKSEPEIWRYLYNGDARKDVEIRLSGNNAINSKNNLTLNSAKVLDELDGGLDSIIFKFKNLNGEKVELNLDTFLMTKLCRDKINQKLHYIRGLSRLLHVIDCRRTEFEVDPDKQQTTHTTRGIKTEVYSAINFPALSSYGEGKQEGNQVKLMNVTVSIEQHVVSNNERAPVLPERAIPLSMSLEFEHPSTSQSITIIINLFQFEVVNLEDHLKEKMDATGESESIFLMPLFVGLNKQLNSQDASSRRRKVPISFSFKATMSSSHIPLGNDPVELIIAHDAERRVLARQVSLINKNELSGDDYKRYATRTVYDYESGYKFHIKQRNNDYYDRYAHDLNNVEKDDLWNACESDSISDVDRSRLVTAGVSSTFELELATYMGQAVVRGILCNVYELELYSLPLWLDLDKAYGGSMKRAKEIHVIIYESARFMRDENLEAEQRARKADELSGKIVRLQVNLLSMPRLMPDEEKDEENSIEILLSFQLEIHQFHWQVYRNLENMFDIGQDCLFTNERVRSRDMELLVEPEKLDNNASKIFYFLGEDRYQRSLSVSRLLANSFLITRTQQVNLETILEIGSRLRIKLKIYELPQTKMNAFLLGYALDESLGSASVGSWSIGATDISLEECKWRVAHTLKQSKYTFTKSGDHESNRVFMYCPVTLHCVLGDSSWLLPNGTLVSYKSSIFKYPANASIENKCIVMKLVQELHLGNHQTKGRKLLDWLSYSKGKFLEEKLELKVDSINAGVKEMKVMLRVLKLTFSDIKETSENQGLVKALQGVGYYYHEDEEEKRLALKVSSVAQCSHLCLMQHQCLSYSICHEGSGLQCLLTKLNWTDPVRVNELNRMVEGRKLSHSIIRSLELQLDESTSQVAQVKLRFSGLCSLYPREHLEIFQHKDSLLELVRNVQYLIHADSVQDCSRFCLNRANIFSLIRRRRQLLREKKQFASNNLETTRETSRNQQVNIGGIMGRAEDDVNDGDEVCSSFKFTRESKTCELLPARKLGEILLFKNSLNESLLSEEESQQVNRWLNGIKKLRDRSRSLHSFEEFETYELNYEQLFTVHSGIHLIINSSEQMEEEKDASLEENNFTWSITVLETGVERCAKLCFEQRNCRSFDVMEEQKPGAAASLNHEKEQDFPTATSTCILNGISLTNVVNVNTSCFVTEQQYNVTGTEEKNENRWWHYEPNELALYMMGNLATQRAIINESNQHCFTILTNSTSLNSGIFIRLDRILINMFTNCLKGTFGVSESLQEQNNVNSNHWLTKISQLFQVILLIMLVVLTVALLYLATKS